MRRLLFELSQHVGVEIRPVVGEVEDHVDGAAPTFRFDTPLSVIERGVNAEAESFGGFE